MVVLTAKVSKGKLVAILLVIAVAVALLVVLSSGAGQGAADTAETTVTAIESNDDRVAYLQSMGWQVDETPVESQEVRIPAQLPEVLARYNELQQSQGFDLRSYAGKTVKRYVYQVLNYPDTTDSYYATLLVYQDQVIGGDVAAASQDGIMQGLQYPETT